MVVSDVERIAAFVSDIQEQYEVSDRALLDREGVDPTRRRAKGGRREAPCLCPWARGPFPATPPLSNGVLDRLKALRGPCESHSDVILRLSEGDSA